MVDETSDAPELDAPNDAETVSELLDRTLSQDELDDLTESDDTPADVTFSSQDFDVAGLVRRLDAETMLIPRFGALDDKVDTAGFQRGFVWNRAQMDRFVESLLLGYPVPAIFIVKQAINNRLLILDGQQRLVTLQRFYQGSHNGKPFALSNVAKEFKGLTYKTLPDPLKLKLDDSYMQATIVAADGSPELNDAIYKIFERLNSGGTQLTPHEIRVALAAGDLIDYLETLNSNLQWRGLYGPKSSRLRDQELVLRIIALYLAADTYSRPLKTFLNSFASHHRSPDAAIEAAGELFGRAVEALATQVGPVAFRRPGSNQVNGAQAEAVTVGVMHAVHNGGSAPTDLEDRIRRLQAEDDFVRATTRATADNDSVDLRLAAAKRILAAP